MISYKHKHVYVYTFPVSSKTSGSIDHEYTLCTNIDNPNCKENRTLLESMLRLVYGHMPKSVKFLYEKR
jgi:hypothetical protein